MKDISRRMTETNTEDPVNLSELERAIAQAALTHPDIYHHMKKPHHHHHPTHHSNKKTLPNHHALGQVFEEVGNEPMDEVYGQQPLEPEDAPPPTQRRRRRRASAPTPTTGGPAKRQSLPKRETHKRHGGDSSHGTRRHSTTTIPTNIETHVQSADDATPADMIRRLHALAEEGFGWAEERLQAIESRGEVEG